MGRIIPYIIEKKNVWNHQPDINVVKLICVIIYIYMYNKYGYNIHDIWLNLVNMNGLI